MPRETIYLGDPEGQALVKGTWKYARGYVPGQPNEGLVEQIEGSPARLADYDDSSWAVCHDLAERNSHGFSFMWYRIDGECNRDRGAIQGFNVPQRVLLSDNPSPGDQHTIALLAANGPLAAPGGTVFCRYANLGFEWTGTESGPNGP